jgi:Ca2+/Na+ antiporter
MLAFDLPVMTAVAVACLPVFFTGGVARWEGAVFLAYYAAYTVYLVLAANRPRRTGHLRPGDEVGPAADGSPCWW